jgi:hypothetical protein
LLTVDQFWSMTPYEINITIGGYCDERERQQRENIHNIITQAWWNRSLIWQQKPPNLETLIKDMDKAIDESKNPKKTSTDDELIAEAKRMNLKGPW